MNENIEIQYLYNSPIHLFYDKKHLEETMNEFKKKNYTVYDFDASEWNSEKIFHEEVAKTLSFPDYYGNNLSALSDCISDMYSAEIPGMIFVFNGFETLEKSNHEFAEQVLDVLADQSRKFLVQGMKYMIFVQSNDPKISFSPVGAVPIVWNNLEWQNATRGL